MKEFKCRLSAHGHTEQGLMTQIDIQGTNDTKSVEVKLKKMKSTQSDASLCCSPHSVSAG
jgi:hypothetical protein